MGFGSQCEQPNCSFVPTVSQFTKEEIAGIHLPHLTPWPDAKEVQTHEVEADGQVNRKVSCTNGLLT